MTLLRAALIGCGKIGSEFAEDPRIRGIYTHAQAWCACEGVELAAVCDTDYKKMQRCGERHGVAVRFQDVEEMLRVARPDIVSICTPDESHASVLGRVLAQPGVRAVLMEKPLALDLAAAEGLVTEAERRGVLLAVNYSRRYSPAHRRLAKRLHAGELGSIQCATGYFSKGTLHNGTHWIDLARMLIGEIDAVAGFDKLRETSPDPTLDARLAFANGASGTLHGLDANFYSLFEMDVVCTRGRVRIVDSGHSFELFAVGDSPHYSGYRTLLWSDRQDGDMHDTLLWAAQDLVAAMRSSRAPLCGGRDGLRALAIGMAVRDSARSGGRLLRV